MRLIQINARYQGNTVLKKTIYIPFLLLLTLAACSKTELTEPTEVAIGDLYALTLPGGFQPSYDLHDFASLQYADPKTNRYLIGLEEPKRDLRNIHLYYGLEEYAHFSYRTLAEGMDTVVKSLRYPSQVNGLDCIMMQVEGLQTRGGEQTGIYYQAAVYESESHFYQLIAWARPDDAPQLQAGMQQSYCTFKELPQSPLLTEENTDTIFRIHPKAEM